MGTRYGGLKQMDPMGPNGETILDYSVFDAIRAGFGKVVFVIREDFAEAFRERRRRPLCRPDRGRLRLPEPRRPARRASRSPRGATKPWGTAHAVRAARDVIREPFAVINADDFYGRRRLPAWPPTTSLRTPPAPDGVHHYAMVGYALDNTLSDHGDVNRGICQLHDAGLLTDVEEVHRASQRNADGVDPRRHGSTADHRELPGDSIVSMNFWAFTPTFFDQLEEQFVRFLEDSGSELKSECYIPTVVDALIGDGERRLPGPADHRQLVRRDLSGRQALRRGQHRQAHRTRRIPVAAPVTAVPEPIRRASPDRLKNAPGNSLSPPLDRATVPSLAFRRGLGLRLTR